MARQRVTPAPNHERGELAAHLMPRHPLGHYPPPLKKSPSPGTRTHPSARRFDTRCLPGARPGTMDHGATVASVKAEIRMRFCQDRTPNHDFPSMQIISNRYLAVTDLPGDRSKRALFEFAVTFDGYAWWGGVEACGAIANAAAQRWEGTGELPKSLTVLRSCLFFEQRRVHLRISTKTSCSCRRPLSRPLR